LGHPFTPDKGFFGDAFLFPFFDEVWKFERSLLGMSRVKIVPHFQPRFAPFGERGGEGFWRELDPLLHGKQEEEEEAEETKKKANREPGQRMAPPFFCKMGGKCSTQQPEKKEIEQLHNSHKFHYSLPTRGLKFNYKGV
jgi:hypothetical protein